MFSITIVSILLTLDSPFYKFDTGWTYNIRFETSFLASNQEDNLYLLKPSIYFKYLLSSKLSFVANPYFMYLNTTDIDKFTQSTANLYNVNINLAGLTASYLPVSLLDFAQLYLRYSLPTLDLYIGRKTYSLGLGYLLQGPMDGLQLSYYTSFMTLTAIAGYTELLYKETDPYIFSYSQVFYKGENGDVKSGSRRINAGFLATFYLLPFLSPYVQSVASLDLRSDLREKYDAFYLGMGFTLSLWKFVLDTEFNFEFGSSPPALVPTDVGIYIFPDPSPIRAWMAAAELKFLFFKLTFLTASGDTDRTSVMSSEGNASVYDVYFKSFSTKTLGYVLRPSFGNLTMISLKMIIPYLDLIGLKAFLSYSYYMKTEEKGLVGGYFGLKESLQMATSTRQGKNIGQAIDLTFLYTPFTDLTINGGIGYFMPGDGVSSRISNVLLFHLGMILTLW